MLPRHAVRELSIAAAIALIIWGGLPEAFIRGSWASLRTSRLFPALCLVAASLVVNVWITPEPPRVDAGDSRSDEQAA
jgi:hypothetical protein